MSWTYSRNIRQQLRNTRQQLQHRWRRILRCRPRNRNLIARIGRLVINAVDLPIVTVPPAYWHVPTILRALLLPVSTVTSVANFLYGCLLVVDLCLNKTAVVTICISAGNDLIFLSNHEKKNSLLTRSLLVNDFRPLF